MKVTDAEKMIEKQKALEIVEPGYLVFFIVDNGSTTSGDTVPDRDEPPFATLKKAEDFAVKLSKSCPRNIDHIYIVTTDHRPVEKAFKWERKDRGWNRKRAT